MVLTIDDVEDGDYSEYSVDKGSGSYVSTVTSPVYEGNYALEIAIDSGENTDIYSTSGLDHYPSQGETFHAFIRSGTTGDNQQVKFGYACSGGFTGSGDAYAIDVRFADQKVNFDRYDGGNGNTIRSDNASLNANEWYELEIIWQSNDDHTVNLYDSSGNKVNGMTVTDGTYTSGGIGLSVQSLGTTTGWMDYVWSEAIEAPTAPRNVSQSVNSDDSITITWDEPSDWGGERGNYRIHLSRDGSNYQGPSGGPTTVNDDGSSSYSASYNPSSDSSYQSQVGIDSSFRFRVRAENSAGNSDWSYSATKNTTPVPPKNPSISRTDGDTVDFSWVAGSDLQPRTDIEYRKDTGAGYGGWSNAETIAASAKGTSVTRSYSVANDAFMEQDARYQFRVAHYHYEDWNNDGNNSLHESPYAYGDYGNDGNVYFADDFEDQDLAEWDTTSLSDADSGIRSDGHGDLGISGAAEGTYWLRLDAEDYVQKSLGDLSGENDVMVKCYMTAGSLDSSVENWSIWWYDGSAWQELRSLHWEHNKQGWVEVTTVVPSSYLSTDNRLRLRAGSGFTAYGGDHSGFDRVVVSDLLHEYTTPNSPSSLSTDTTIEDELSASWSLNATFEGAVETDFGPTGGTLSETSYAAGTTSDTWTGLNDGESYDINVQSVVYQDRHGFNSTSWDSASLSGSDVTLLPAPTNLSVVAKTATSFDVSWVDNHDYGDVKLEIKRSSSTTWSTDATLSIGDETHTFSGLLNGEEYDMRTLANTEHTQTEDA